MLACTILYDAYIRFRLRRTLPYFSPKKIYTHGCRLRVSAHTHERYKRLGLFFPLWIFIYFPSFARLFPVIIIIYKNKTTEAPGYGPKISAEQKKNKK